MRGVESEGAHKQTSHMSFIFPPLSPVKPIVIIPFSLATSKAFKIFLLLSFFINFFPLFPNGNFFNNWLNILMYLPFGFFLYKFELKNHIPLWEREDYEHKFINKVYNINNYKKIICIIGLDSFYINYNEIYKYLNEYNYDFLLLDNKCEIEYLWKFINIIENNINNKFSLFKVYSILNATNEQLIKYFNICYNYLNIEDTIILNNNKRKI